MNRCRGRETLAGGLRRGRICTKTCVGGAREEAPPRRRTKPVMEFWTLIDQLEDAVRSAKRAPLSSDVRVDREAARAIISRLPGAIPDELREAQRITENRDEMLAQARFEATQILEEARDQSAHLLDSDAIAEGADLRAQELLEAAAASERELHLGALRHASDVLDDLDAYLLTLGETVARGRDRRAERTPDQLIERDPDRLVASKGHGIPEPSATLASSPQLP